MSHFAKIENGIVTQVIVAEPEFVKTLETRPLTCWVRTSYRTYGGQHPEGKPLRKNYAGIGYTYDKARDAFIPPKPYASWILNEDTCLWNSPVPMPEDDKVYTWDEESLNWVKAQENLGE